jgi:hypothetical protein
MRLCGRPDCAPRQRRMAWTDAQSTSPTTTPEDIGMVKSRATRRRAAPDARGVSAPGAAQHPSANLHGPRCGAQVKISSWPCVTRPLRYLQLLAWSELTRDLPQTHRGNWQPSTACGRPLRSELEPLLRPFTAYSRELAVTCSARMAEATVALFITSSAAHVIG